MELKYEERRETVTGSGDGGETSEDPLDGSLLHYGGGLYRPAGFNLHHRWLIDERC